MSQLEHIYNQLNIYEQRLNNRLQANEVNKEEVKQIEVINQLVTKINNKFNSNRKKIHQKAQVPITNISFNDFKQIQPIKNYKFSISVDSLILVNDKNDAIRIYVSQDIYSDAEIKPLQISDESNLFEAYRIKNFATWSQIYDVLDKYQINLLEGINELVINTQLSTLNIDLKRFVKAIEAIADILDKHADKLNLVGDNDE